jgi:mono/diheme cytochrome c family protein
MGNRIILQVVAALASVALSVPAIAAEKAAKSSANTAAKTDIERGRYLVAVSGCNDCHTPGFLVQGNKVPQKDWLTGGVLGWRGPWGTTYPANLRLYFQEITEEQWVHVAKEIQRRPPMPYYSLNQMAEPDVRAMYKYIRSLGPAGKPAPKYVPPDKVPPQPYVQFPDKLD